MKDKMKFSVGFVVGLITATTLLETHVKLTVRSHNRLYAKYTSAWNYIKATVDDLPTEETVGKLKREMQYIEQVYSD